MSAVMCWDHCHSCGRSSGRFYVTSKAEFDKAIADTEPKCPFCKGKLVCYHDSNKEIFPAWDEHTVCLCGGGNCGDKECIRAELAAMQKKKAGWSEKYKDLPLPEWIDERIGRMMKELVQE